MNTKYIKIERIYVTRGDNLIDELGRKCDKCVGFKISTLGIIWFQNNFAELEELESLFDDFNIAMVGEEWGVFDCNGRAEINRKITKISKHHDDIFKTDSFYTKHRLQGKVWWYAEELRKWLNEKKLRLM